VLEPSILPGPFAVDDLRLSSAAPRGPAPPGLVSGSVLDAGTSGRGSYDHVRVDVRQPSWLVLGEGYNRGWQAWCDGRSLGPSTPIDGYANAWRVRPGCHAVRLAFGPNRLALIGYVVSAVAVLGCLLLLAAAAWWRSRRPLDRGLAPADGLRPPERLWAPAPGAATPVSRPASPVRTVLTVLAAAVVFGFTFGVAAGVGSLVVIAIVVWRGIGAARLALAAGVLLGIVVPLLYLIGPADQLGGNHYGYAAQHITAHWAGVGAIGLLMGALWRTLRRPPKRCKRAPGAVADRAGGSDSVP